MGLKILYLPSNPRLLLGPAPNSDPGGGGTSFFFADELNN